eukprot:349850-Chlamydomonas_euryale.AAC.1
MAATANGHERGLKYTRRGRSTDAVSRDRERLECDSTFSHSAAQRAPHVRTHARDVRSADGPRLSKRPILLGHGEVGEDGFHSATNVRSLNGRGACAVLRKLHAAGGVCRALRAVCRVGRVPCPASCMRVCVCVCVLRPVSRAGGVRGGACAVPRELCAGG